MTASGGVGARSLALGSLDRFDGFGHGVLQLVEPTPRVGFGLPVALLLVVELLADFLIRRRAAERAAESAWRRVL
jgi:hypothetical protein